MSATVHAYGTMPRTVRDWDAALRDVSSGEDSDAGDSLNVLQVQKNAKRVAELVHTMVPGMAVDHLMGRTPMGMNRPDAIRNDLSAAMQQMEASARANRSLAPSAARAAEADRTTPPADEDPNSCTA